MSEPALSASAEAVLTFLESVGRRSEAELYLRLFRKLPKQSFAILAAEAPVVRQARGTLVEGLRFLAELGLFAPLVIGLFDPRAAERSSESLSRRMAAAGLEPREYLAEDHDLATKLSEDLSSERCPVVRFAPDGRDKPQRFALLAELAEALATRKVVFVRSHGGIGPHGVRQVDLGQGHSLMGHSGGISVVNLRTDLAALKKSGLLKRDDQRLLEQVAELLTRPQLTQLSASVTSPLNLLAELFTVKGAGTLIKLGSPVSRYASYQELDRARLQRLLETSFGKPLNPDFFSRPTLAIHLEADYRGAAIVEPSAVGPFLSKFAVDPIAQGEGLGHDLWHSLSEAHASLFWRARATNPVATWYALICDGMQRGPNWHVFWRGLPTESIPDALKNATDRDPDFAE